MRSGSDAYGAGAELSFINPDELRAFLRGLNVLLAGRAPTRAEWDTAFLVTDAMLTDAIRTNDVEEREAEDCDCDCEACQAFRRDHF